LISSVVWSPTRSSSINGHFYYVIFINHFSKYVSLYPIKHNPDVSHIFPIFKYLVENQLNTKKLKLFTQTMVVNILNLGLSFKVIE